MWTCHIDEHYEEEETGKYRSNIIVNYNGIDYQIFKDRLIDYRENRRLIFDLLGVKIYWKTDQEILKKMICHLKKLTINHINHII